MKRIPKIGATVRAYDGKDEKIRGYLVKTKNGMKRTTDLNRGEFIAVITEAGGALDLSEIKSK